ncbi:MAG TPA: hypothetical protein VKR06_28830 [Ktedonosporobacter sp.]|nr:hypothetical protein [Ktedonosporobacter sp.]
MRVPSGEFDPAAEAGCGVGLDLPYDIDCHTFQGSKGACAVAFGLAVGVFPQEHIQHPVQLVFDTPVVTDKQMQGCGYQQSDWSSNTAIAQSPRLVSGGMN